MDGHALPRLIAVVVASAVAVTSAAACGGGDSQPARATDQRELRQVVKDLQRSFLAGDRQGVCDRMSAGARRQAGLVAHGSPDACPADIAEAFRTVESGGVMVGGRGARVVGAPATGGSASAEVRLAHGATVGVPLVRERDGWRLATFFGTPPNRAMAFVKADRTAPFPAAGRPVEVSDRSGLPCFPVFADGYPEVAGGCELHAVASRIEITIDTVFGSFKFGECDLEYRMAVDGRGRSWTHSVVFTGPDNLNNGCSDMDPCENAANESLPWKSRIGGTADGGLTHRMNVCLDTCIGFYAGPLTIGLSKGQAWRATAASAGVGDSGLRLDGRIDLGGGGIEIGA